MICYKDRTYCASPDCQNACGRKLLEPVMMDSMYVMYGYFCGEPEPKTKADRNPKENSTDELSM